MQSFLEPFNQYAKTELMAVIPVLYAINQIASQMNVKTERLPLFTVVSSVALCGIYTFATARITNFPEILMAIFVSVTQGVLFAGVCIVGMILSGPPNGDLTKRQKKAGRKK